jgi:nucleoside-diphosphate-sugar epimerase
VRKAVRDADPDAIVHQGTALADARFGRNFDRTFAQTNRLRTEGRGNLLAAANDGLIEPVRKRQLPIVGDGDDEPAPEREWLPVLAEALGAKPPRHVPVWLARLIAGEFAVMMGTDARAASNAKAKRELGWRPRYATWRDGFAASLT